MDINQTLLSAIDELYAGALDPARLTSSLCQVAQIAGASGGVLYLMHEGERRMTHSALSNFDLNSHGKFDGVLAEQGHYYRRMPLGSPIHLHTVWPIKNMKNSEFFQEVLEKQDVLYGAGTLLLRKSGLHGMIVLNRSEGAGPFTAQHFDTLRVLAPHLNRVMQITLEMNAIAREREVFASALDSTSFGVVLTDGRGKVLHLNRAAEEIVANDDGLAIQQGRLIADSHAEDRALERLIGQASSSVSGSSFQRGGTCRVNRRSGLPPLLLLVTPCSDVQARAFAPLLPACAVLIRDPSRRQPDAANLLRQTFALTAQEARVAIGISEGHGLANAAEQMGLSPLTVRNHLQRVFDKTNTSRQAELVRLVAAIVAEGPQHLS